MGVQGKAAGALGGVQPTGISGAGKEGAAGHVVGAGKQGPWEGKARRGCTRGQRGKASLPEGEGGIR